MLFCASPRLSSNFTQWWVGTPRSRRKLAVKRYLLAIHMSLNCSCPVAARQRTMFYRDARHIRRMWCFAASYSDYWVLESGRHFHMESYFGDSQALEQSAWIARHAKQLQKLLPLWMIIWTNETFLIRDCAKVSFVLTNLFGVDNRCPPQHTLARKNHTGKVWVTKPAPNIFINHYSAVCALLHQNPSLNLEDYNFLSIQKSSALITHISVFVIGGMKLTQQRSLGFAPRKLASFLGHRISLVRKVSEVHQFAGGPQINHLRPPH